jgi:hypothetical protein
MNYEILESKKIKTFAGLGELIKNLPRYSRGKNCKAFNGDDRDHSVDRIRYVMIQEKENGNNKTTYCR